MSNTPFDSASVSSIQPVSAVHGEAVAVPADDPGVAALQARLADAERRCAALVNERDDMFRIIAHDLRAPLRHITSFGLLVRESLHEPGGVQEAGDYLDIIDRSSRYMGRMIDGLDALAQLSRAHCHPVELDLLALVHEARLGLVAETAGRDIAWHLPPEPLLVSADATLLRMVLHQLLSNAIKFTRKQALPVIDVRWRVDGNDLHVTLRDNGAGFNPAQVDRLFGMFQRLHRETDFEGVGSGLALTRRAVERLGGRIAIDGAVQQGCTVKFSIPMQAV